MSNRLMMFSKPIIPFWWLLLIKNPQEFKSFMVAKLFKSQNLGLTYRADTRKVVKVKDGS